MKNELTPSIATMEAILACYGYEVQPRDPLRNPEFSGSLMLVDMQETAEQGGYCIVGDDRAELIADAFAWLDIPADNNPPHPAITEIYRGRKAATKNTQ